MRIAFELSDNDLKHFQKIMRKAVSAAKVTDPDHIITAASKLLVEVRAAKVPDFIVERLQKLDMLIAMVGDAGWALPLTEKKRVLSALAYFADPDDLIPDEIPGLGFLDDAIMIELVVRELHHEIDAYQDFCRYREAEATRQGTTADGLARADFLTQRRQQLHSRMRRRRDRRSRRSTSGRGPFSLF